MTVQRNGTWALTREELADRLVMLVQWRYCPKRAQEVAGEMLRAHKDGAVGIGWSLEVGWFCCWSDGPKVEIKLPISHWV